MQMCGLTTKILKPLLESNHIFSYILDSITQEYDIKSAFILTVMY